MKRAAATRAAPLRKPLSATMAIALAETIEHGGCLVRHIGGYWTYPGCTRDRGGYLEWHIGASTVDALVSRGELEYSEWKNSRNRRFPIAARTIAAADAASLLGVLAESGAA